jgi:hypothetical protein
VGAPEGAMPWGAKIQLHRGCRRSYSRACFLVEAPEGAMLLSTTSPLQSSPLNRASRIVICALR